MSENQTGWLPPFEVDPRDMINVTEDFAPGQKICIEGAPRWRPIDLAPRDDVVDLWGPSEDRGIMRWPNCWWGPSFPDAGYDGPIEDAWYCRLGPLLFKVYPTHFILIPPGPAP